MRAKLYVESVTPIRTTLEVYDSCRSRTMAKSKLAARSYPDKEDKAERKLGKIPTVKEEKAENMKKKGK
jgi:hypothetical protein